ncbi:MAG: hypothetical protein EA378_10705 [Phycisphaerales bacterium]|nr:MAG: hypothetical protein EA378_10705 [Phycisphaerales bacterium]
MASHPSPPRTSCALTPRSRTHPPPTDEPGVMPNTPHNPFGHPADPLQPPPAREPPSSAHKIHDLPALAALRERARAEGRRVVQCHGCFDIVHPGHVRHLRYAKALGDVLLVTVTADAGIDKGVGRPLIPQELRAENLAALDFVDWVHIDHHPTAAELLAAVQPDVYVKGREYESNDDPRFRKERETVERAGGSVVFSSGDVVFSSTALIGAMEQSVDPTHARLAALHDRPELLGPRLFDRIARFRNQRVVIVGETILDTYVLCDRPDVAGESPIMTLRPLERRHYDGGAAVLARHAAAMGARPILITALPTRGPSAEAAEALRRRLTAEGVDVRCVRQDHALAEKQRFLVGTQKVMKLDLVEPPAIDAARLDELVQLATDAASEHGGADAAIIADFGLGLLTPAMVRRLSKALRPRARVLAGDVSGKRSHLRDLEHADLLCPSESELREAYQAHAEGLPVVVWELLQETKAAAAIVTMGPEGLVAFDRLAVPEGARAEQWPSRVRGEHVPALAPIAVDALGCGDALLTAATLTLAAGGDLVQAAYLGALSASLEAQRIGNVPVAASDLRRAVVRLQSATLAFADSEVLRAAHPHASKRPETQQPTTQQPRRATIAEAS